MTTNPLKLGFLHCLHCTPRTLQRCRSELSRHWKMAFGKFLIVDFYSDDTWFIWFNIMRKQCLQYGCYAAALAQKLESLGCANNRFHVRTPKEVSHLLTKHGQLVCYNSEVYFVPDCSTDGLRRHSQEFAKTAQCVSDSPMY